ncbi:MAG: TatD family hydrolase [Gammaproteobacteria bacterium]
MPALLVDSHCHLDRLDLAAIGGDMDAVMQTAREHGIGHMLCVSIDMESYPAMLSLVKQYDHVFASVGVHPNEREGREPSMEELITLAQDSKIVAIGETGLDYFRNEGDLEWQHERFRRHIAAAKITGKPLIVHTREAKQDTLRLLREEGADQVGGVMHCFTEDWETARQAMDLNFYISFSGIVTFNSARELKEVAARMPADRILVETDSPYLAPIPYRGKTNQPAYTRFVAEQIAALRGVSLEEITEITTANFFNLFRQAR